MKYARARTPRRGHPTAASPPRERPERKSQREAFRQRLWFRSSVGREIPLFVFKALLFRDPCRFAARDFSTLRCGAGRRSSSQFLDSSTLSVCRLHAEVRIHAREGVAKDRAASSGGNQNLFLYHRFAGDLTFGKFTIRLQHEGDRLLEVLSCFSKGLALSVCTGQFLDVADPPIPVLLEYRSEGVVHTRKLQSRGILSFEYGHVARVFRG